MRTAPWQLLPILLLAGCSAATARSVVVTDGESLRKAVASARSGDRIMLAPGVYPALEIHKRAIEGAPVTISGTNAHIQGVSIVNSSGWAFDGLTFGGTYLTRNRVVFIQQSSDIAIRNSRVQGIKVNNDPWDDKGVGIGLRFARNVEIVGNRFRDLYMGFVAGSSSDIRFEGNSLAFLREGSNWVAVNTATIRCNRFSHIYPNWLRKEHPDAIQGWFNKDGPNQNWLLEGNVINTGGPRAIQGIFLAGSYKPGGDPKNHMRNITIRDNIYYGSSLHGISLSGTVDTVIERNTVLPSPHTQQDTRPLRSADGRRSSALVPRIRILGDVSTGRVSENIAVLYTIPPMMEGRNNLKLGLRSSSSSWKRTFIDPPFGDDPSDSSFRIDPDSPAGRSGQGARSICGNLLPPPVDLPSGVDPSTSGQQAQAAN